MHKNCIIIAIVLLGCKAPSDQKPVSTKANFDFLVGQWVRTNESEGVVTKEQWVKKSDDIYVSHAYSVENTDTIFQEFASIKRSGDTWNMEVRMPQEDTVTIFEMQDFTDSTFVVVNDKNAFPKMIKYANRKGNLYAIISGGGPDIEFFFTKE